MSNLEKWKQICLESDNVASEVLNSEEAKAELTIDEATELLNYFGDNEYVIINDDYEFIPITPPRAILESTKHLITTYDKDNNQFTPKDFEDKYKIYGYFGFAEPPYFTGAEIRIDIEKLLKADDRLFAYYDDGILYAADDGANLTKNTLEAFKRSFLIGNKKEGKYPLSNNKQYYLAMVGKHEDVLIAKAKKKKED